MEADTTRTAESKGFDNPPEVGENRRTPRSHAFQRNLSLPCGVLDCELAVSDDSELIAQTLKGCPAAFGVLVRKYQDRLYNSMVRVVGHAEDAQDIVQDTFIQAFLKLETFQQSSAFFTWVYRIGFNIAATYRRRKRPIGSVDQMREATGQDPPDSGVHVSQRIEQEERRQQVQAAIARLGDEYRAVLVLREIEGCCYEAIAEILDLPLGTVRSRLHRARLQLREQLKQVLTFDS